MSAGDSDASDGALRVGESVRVRRQRWVVAANEGKGQSRQLTVTGSDPANLHERRRFLASFEIIEHAPRDARLRSRRVRRDRWTAACRTLLVRERPWTALQAAERASVDILPHQLAPAIALLEGAACRILLADGVGLGKTIQATIALAELLARGAASRALLLTPAGLRDQWADELRHRFGLHAEIVDRHTVRMLGVALPPDVNPWQTVSLAIASLDYVKRPEVLPAVISKPWDVVLIDEAHLVSPTSDRLVAASALCAAAAFVILLTATPHAGDERSFDALCGLGDLGDPLLVFRRGRGEVGLASRRRVHRQTVAPTPAEVHMHAALGRYVERVRSARSSNEAAAALLVSILQKRAWSSAASLHRSIERRLAALTDTASPVDVQLTLPFDDGEADDGDAPPDQLLTSPVLEDVETERRLLAEVAAASACAAEAESKQTALARLLGRCRRLGERVIVFTEYRDTLLDLHRALPFAGELLHGGLDRAARRCAVEAFVSGRAWLLLSTDAGSEGLNLHHTCRVVVHVELPWSPMRLEQRIGRVDRIGQTRPVHVWCLLGRGTGEMQLIDSLKAKVDRARQDIATRDPLLSSSAPVARRATAAPGDERVAPLGEPGESRARPANPVDTASSQRSAPAIDTRPGTRRPALAEPSPALDSESRIEAERIARCRTLAAATTLPGIGRTALVATARGRLRRMCRDDALLLLEWVVDDPQGRPIASCLAARVAHLTRPVGKHDGTRLIDALLAIRPRELDLDARAVAWQSATRAQFAAFWRMCLARTEALGATLAGTAVAPFQPGLFDRRAERNRLSLTSEAAARLEHIDDRHKLCRHQLSMTGDARIHTVLALVP